MPIPEIHIPREATLVVAASNSKTPSADYVCSGANDHVEIQAALDALPATGGCIFLLDGTYALGAQVVRAIDDVKFIGCGQATLLTLDGGTAVITAGAQDGWLFADFATDAGGPAIGGATESAIRNVWIAGVRTDDPAGGGDAVISVAADNTPAQQKGRADFVCSGANDEVTIQALVAAGVTVKLMVGDFVFNDTLDILVSNFRLEGSGAGTVIGGILAVDYIKIGNNSVAVDQVELVDFRIDGTAQTAGHGIEVDGVGNNITRLLFENLIIENVFTYGIELENAEECRIVDCEILDAGTYGIRLDLSHHNLVVGCNIRGGTRGIDMINANHNNVTGCNISACSVTSIRMQQCDADVISGNCLADSGQYGFYITNSEACVITGNDLKASQEEGIYGSTCSHLIITNNILKDNGTKTDDTYSAIFLTTCWLCTVSHNVIWSEQANEPQYGIEEAGTSNENQYVGNRILNCVSGPMFLLFGENSIARANPEASSNEERKSVRMKNTSGGALATGDVVVHKAVAAGDEVDTTVNKGDDKVWGMYNNRHNAIADNAYAPVLMEGKTVDLKVDGTDNIAIGDFLCTFTAAGIACKAGAGDMVFAIALAVYETDDSNGVIDALLIVPRKI